LVELNKFRYLESASVGGTLPHPLPLAHPLPLGVYF
jgi:hypothetical protein